MLTEHQEALNRLVVALLSDETVERDKLVQLLGEPAAPRPRPPVPTSTAYRQRSPAPAHDGRPNRALALVEPSARNG